MAWYDNLMTGLMPGESSGIPDNSGFQGQVGGLLSGQNPLFNLGLGILANNNSRNFGQVIGRGAQQGMQMTQQQQQLARQNKISDLQMKRYGQEQKKYDLEQQALADFDTKFPQYKGLAQIDPKSALKIAYPDLAGNSADPFFQPIPTEQGLGKFNARTGQFELLTDPTGRPIVKSSDSPAIRGGVKAAEAAATAGYKVNTDIPGQLYTDKQVAQMADPSLGGLPQGIPAGTPMLPQNVQGNFNGNPQAIMSQINRIRDPQERASATAAFNQQFGQQPVQAAPISNSYGGGGVRIPTPAEQAALTTTATEQAKANVGIATDKTKNVKKAEQFLSVAQQASELLSDKNNRPTESGIGAAVDATGNLFGIAAKGSVPAAKLEALSGWLVANVPRMEGPQSNFDVQNYQTMAGLIGDRTKPLEIRQGALKEVIRLQEKYKSLNQDGAILPKDEQMPEVKSIALPAKPSALTLKKGQVYSTPKGNLKWNGKEFED